MIIVETFFDIIHFYLLWKRYLVGGGLLAFFFWGEGGRSKKHDASKRNISFFNIITETDILILNSAVMTLSLISFLKSIIS